MSDDKTQRTILIEVETVENTPEKKGSSGIGKDFVSSSKTKTEKTVEKVAVEMEAVTDEIANISNDLAASMNKMTWAPTEMEVEFGVKIDGKANIFVAQTGIEANFQVKLKWIKGK